MVRENAVGCLSSRQNAIGQWFNEYFIAGTTFEILDDYILEERVGQGSYGTVVSAVRRETGEAVAVKKVESLFDHVMFSRRTLREVRIVRHLSHENIVNIYSMFIPATKETYDSVYLISDLMESDLGWIIKSNCNLSEEHIQFFLYQILCALKYIHSAWLIHCDIRPSNCLVNANCDLKIADFGQACVNFPADVNKFTPMTEYLCTRWYRAPEALCSSSFTEVIDIWSTGCTFAEMMNGKPLFPGQSTRDQLRLFADILGTDSLDILNHIGNEKCARFLETLDKTPKCDFMEMFPSATEEALEMLFGMVEVDPTKRLTAELSLNCAYLKALHSEDDEQTRGPLELSDFEFERRKVDEAVLRHELYREMLEFHPAYRETLEFIELYPERFPREEPSAFPRLSDCRMRAGASDWAEQPRAAAAAAG
jgi:serine/threonine protein kinase